MCEAPGKQAGPLGSPVPRAGAVGLGEGGEHSHSGQVALTHFHSSSSCSLMVPSSVMSTTTSWGRAVKKSTTSHVTAPTTIELRPRSSVTWARGTGRWCLSPAPRFQAPPWALPAPHTHLDLQVLVHRGHEDPLLLVPGLAVIWLYPALQPPSLTAQAHEYLQRRQREVQRQPQGNPLTACPGPPRIPLAVPHTGLRDRGVHSPPSL